jgi:hypothetical protein
MDMTNNLCEVLASLRELYEPLKNWPELEKET